MSDNTSNRTSATLLGRVRDASDHAAWAAFVERYGRLIYGWCREHDLQQADCEDVTQQVLATLCTTLRTFQYDPSQGRFRNYLLVAARRALAELRRGQNRAGLAVGAAAEGIFESVESREDLAVRLEREFDVELLEIALRAVAARVEEQSMQAFLLTALDGLSGEEAAARLHMKVTAVYMARSRVQRLLKEEVAKLEAGN